MKIAGVTDYDPRDVRAFGGRSYYMIQALKNQSTSFEYIGPLRQPKLYSLLFKLKRRFYKRFLKKHYSPVRDVLLLKEYARQISRKLSRLDVDILFSPLSQGSQPFAYLECDRPMVIWTDSTFASVLDFYPEWDSRRVCKETLRDGIANERSALSRCSLLIYASEWAANIAIKSYQLDPSKVKVVPFGPNLDCKRNLDEIGTIIDSRPSDRCNLLFLGADWHRKGGDIALQVAKKLNEAGLKTELTIVGCYPTLNEPLPDFVKVRGYICKSTQKGIDEINRLMAQSHFFILPSVAEAFGYVFSEASSFGLPSLATNVGGIPSAVRDDRNGKTFAKDANIEEYCTYILDLFSNYNRYKELALSSFNEYESRLNWSVATKTVKNFMMEIL
jgi:glycosyltransferase involved in cell wall biosynthesis